MATKVGLAKIWMTPLDWPTPKTPQRCKILGSILIACWVIVIFVWKFPHFRYHGNMGWFDKNFMYTVKSVVPENPYLAQDSWRYLIHKLSYSRLSDEIYRFLLPMATKVGLAKIWMTPLDWPTPKTPTQMQNSGIYLKCELSYCDFCVEISTCSLPWQHGLVWQKFH